MQIHKDQIDSIRLLSLIGKVDDENAAVLQDHLQQDIQAGVRLVILDLRQVDYISSSGLGVISAKYISLDVREGCLVLAHLNPKIKRIFTLTKILQVIPHFDSVADAAGYLKALSRQQV